MYKTVQGIYSPPSPHWVGNGFPVKTLFSYPQHGLRISPFLLLDHAGPANFPPNGEHRGVGVHPHRGFATVTIVYSGEVSHRDSTGAGGTIGPGEVQWMTAASGVLHEEMHSPAFVRSGGQLEMVQLWVNLPARHKMEAPSYQALTQADIPEVRLPKQAGSVRVIAGDYLGHPGAALTHSAINLWDLDLRQAAELEVELPVGHNLMLMILQGSVETQKQTAHAGQLLHLSSQGQRLQLTALTQAKVLLMGGAPIEEPIAGQGPFVMNTDAELRQAFDDFHSGQFGQIPRSNDLQRSRA